MIWADFVSDGEDLLALCVDQGCVEAADLQVLGLLGLFLLELLHLADELVLLLSLDLVLGDRVACSVSVDVHTCVQRAV